MKKYIIMLAALTMILGSCQTDEEPGFENEVQLDAIYPSSNQTRVTDNHFDSEDQIGFYMVQHVEGEDPILQYAGNYATNISATYNGSKWICAPRILWENGTYDFYAYYPFDKHPSSIENLNFQVQLDQSGEGYSQSDFLWTTSPNVKASTSAVPLIFKHRLSRINIVFVKGQDYTGDLPYNADVYVHNTIPHALINLRTGDVICNNKLPAQTIKARHILGASYEAIIVPQRIFNKVPLIEVIVNNVSYLVESRFIFQPGKSYLFKVILSDNAEKIKIEIGSGVENFG